MDDTLFENYVSEAIDRIPQQYQEKMKSIAIIVADEPTLEQRIKLRMKPYAGLFGLYEGVPLPRRGGATLTIPPDVITIFKYPMMNLYQDPAELKKQVYETLWHEVAHFFGLDHDDMDARKINKNNI